MAKDPNRKAREMRNAIDAVELALNGLEIDSIVRLWDGASDSVMVRVPLGALRQLARCYPELNRIINSAEFDAYAAGRGADVSSPGESNG